LTPERFKKHKKKGGSYMGLFGIDWKNDPLGIDKINEDTGKFLDSLPFIGSARQSERNLTFQKENLAYQKQLQQEIFSREDDSYSRKVSDLKAAGLSPVLAAGGSGSGAGQVIATTAPKESKDDSQSIALIMGLMRMKQDISMTAKQEELMDAQISQIKTNAWGSRVKTDQFLKDSRKFGHGFGPTGLRKGFTEFGSAAVEYGKKALDFVRPSDPAEYKRRVRELDDILKKANPNWNYDSNWKYGGKR
jgi:hypothetical protein